jgi:hypothetical protein
MAPPLDIPKVLGEATGDSGIDITDKPAVIQEGGGPIPDVVPRPTPPPIGGGVPTGGTPDAPGAGLPGRVLKMHSLHCHEAEDWSGDEAILSVFVDNLPAPMPVGGKQDMDEGDTWILNGVVPFLEHVRIELKEEDSPDPHDHLGTVNIGTAPVRGAQAKFTQDDADYTLSYDVLEPKELAADQLAKLKSFLGV